MVILKTMTDHTTNTKSVLVQGGMSDVAAYYSTDLNMSFDQIAAMGFKYREKACPFIIAEGLEYRR